MATVCVYISLFYIIQANSCAASWQHLLFPSVLWRTSFQPLFCDSLPLSSLAPLALQTTVCLYSSTRLLWHPCPIAFSSFSSYSTHRCKGHCMKDTYTVTNEAFTGTNDAFIVIQPCTHCHQPSIYLHVTSTRWGHVLMGGSYVRTYLDYTLHVMTEISRLCIPFTLHR